MNILGSCKDKNLYKVTKIGILDTGWATSEKGCSLYSLFPLKETTQN